MSNMLVLQWTPSLRCCSCRDNINILCVLFSSIVCQSCRLPTHKRRLGGKSTTGARGLYDSFNYLLFLMQRALVWLGVYFWILPDGWIDRQTCIYFQTWFKQMSREQLKYFMKILQNTSSCVYSTFTLCSACKQSQMGSQYIYNKGLSHFLHNKIQNLYILLYILFASHVM